MSESVPPDTAPVLTLYRQLFDALERDGVDYCVWKNLNELPAALAGDSDIDLHVRGGARGAFLDTLRAHRFVRVETHKAHPWVAHYYGHDEQSGRLCHLHCYFRLVTGESHIKQYVVPLERHLDALPAARNALGVREMHPLLQSRLYLLRRRIKLTCLPGALLYFRERAGYRAERALLERHGGQPGEPAPIDGWPATIAASGPLRHEVAAGFAYRHRFRLWSRFAPFSTPLMRYGVIVVRTLGKLSGWRKTLPFGLLVMVAADGAHSERIHGALRDWLGSDFQLRSFHLPDGDDGTTPRRLLHRCRRRNSTMRAAVRSSTGGSLTICYGWRPSQLRTVLVAQASAIGTNGFFRRALERCVALLDDAPEPDMVLHAGSVVVSCSEVGGAALIEIGDGVATARWRQAFWAALVARQP